MSQGIWSRLGIPPTYEAPEIRRAYARRLRERRPDEDAEAFQELRQAYETALLLASGAGDDLWPDPAASPEEAAKDEDAAPAPLGSEPSTEEEPPEPPARLLVAELELALGSANPAEASRRLGEILGQLDLSLAASEELELELAHWLGRQEEPPMALARAVAERFAWFERASKVGDSLPFAAYPLVFRLRQEALEAARLPSDTPGSWSFYRGLFQTLLCLVMPTILARLIPGNHRDDERLLFLALIVPFFVEKARGLLEPAWGRYLQWLPTFALWGVVGFAFAAQTQLRSTNYPLWWTASLLAILLTFRDRQPIGALALDLAGYAAFVACLVGPVQAVAETPFGYFFALPLLFSRDRLFGPSQVGREIERFIFQGGFYFMAILSCLPPERIDARRVFLGMTIVFFVLLFRSYRLRPALLLVFCPLPWLAAKLCGTSLYSSPLLVLSYLPLIWIAAAIVERSEPD